MNLGFRSRLSKHLLFAAAFQIATAGFAQHENIPVNRSVVVEAFDVCPTQMEVGFEAVDQMGDRFLTRDAPKLFAEFEGAKTMDQCFEMVVMEKPFPAVVMPDGKIYITDGHHRASMVARTNASGKLGNPAQISVVITRNFFLEGKTMEEAADAMKNRVYFTPEVRELIRSGKITPLQAFRKYLPKTLAELKDNPLRSLVGEVFKRFGIESEHLNDYIEFMIAEKLELEGIKRRDVVRKISDKAFLDRVGKDIFEDDEVVDLLKNQRRLGDSIRTNRVFKKGRLISETKVNQGPHAEIAERELMAARQQAKAVNAEPLPRARRTGLNRVPAGNPSGPSGTPIVPTTPASGSCAGSWTGVRI